MPETNDSFLLFFSSSFHTPVERVSTSGKGRKEERKKERGNPPALNHPPIPDIEQKDESRKKGSSS